jgi:hypothetical protein
MLLHGYNSYLLLLTAFSNTGGMVEPAPEKCFVVRACSSTYAILGGIPLVLDCIWLDFALQGEMSAWWAVAILSITLVFAILWVSRFLISISGETLSYRSLFAGTRSLRFTEIQSAEINADIEFETHERFAPLFKLILWPEPFSGKKPLIINMKVFGRQDLTRVLDLLGPKLRTGRRFSMSSNERKNFFRKLPG